MNKKNLLELLLYLTEIKSRNKIKGKDLWELEKHVKYIKELIEDIDSQKPINKDGKSKILSGIIKWILRFLMSP